MEDIIEAIETMDPTLLNVAVPESPSTTTLPPPPLPPPPHVIDNQKSLHEALGNLNIDDYDSKDEGWKSGRRN